MEPDKENEYDPIKEFEKFERKYFENKQESKAAIESLKKIVFSLFDKYELLSPDEAIALVTDLVSSTAGTQYKLLIELWYKKWISETINKGVEYGSKDS